MDIHRAQMENIPEMKRLIDEFAARNAMLSRSLNSMYQNVRDYFVCIDDDGKIVGCTALHVVWADLAEVKSVAVDESCHGKGVGRQLVEAAIEDARSLHLPRVFCLTYVPDFFEKLDFRVVDKAELPHTVWAECVNCVKFPDCDEIAMIRDLR